MSISSTAFNVVLATMHLVLIGGAALSQEIQTLGAEDENCLVGGCAIETKEVESCSGIGLFGEFVVSPEYCNDGIVDPTGGSSFISTPYTFNQELLEEEVEFPFAPGGSF